MPRRPARPRQLPPPVPAVTRAELEGLRVPAHRAARSKTAYRFVYERRYGDQDGQVCRTYRVRFKKQNDATGKPVYEDYSANWTTQRAAAEFAAGLLKLRYGPDWATITASGQANGRPTVWKAVRCENDTSRWWLLVLIDGRWYRVSEPHYGDGAFHSEKHALWYVKQWAAAKFGLPGPSALGFTPVPRDTLPEADAAARVERVGRFRYRQKNFFAEDIVAAAVAAVPPVETLDGVTRAGHSA